jgi:hypothetical protein
MRPASYVPGELIPRALSGSIPELPHVEKVFWEWGTKFSRAADAFHARRREGPRRFSAKRPWSFVSTLQSMAVVESLQNQI